jgi:carboxylate-amine ligase
LRAASPPESDGTVALLSEGPDSVAWSEHQLLSEQLGIAVITPRDLSTARGRLHARSGPRRLRVDVLYRRVDGERLTLPNGAPNELGELLLPALRAGRLRCVNSFGTGIADDKLTHAYTERMIDYYLGEEPLLRSVPAYDLAQPDDRNDAMDRLEEMVIKPRGGFGGSGVVLLPKATEGARREAIARVRRSPDDFVAQEMVRLSTHPTICGNRLRPRHVDLRPFAATDGKTTHTLPGGLTRYAVGAGDMVVNSSQGGGGKDTWVVKA